MAIWSEITKVFSESFDLYWNYTRMWFKHPVLESQFAIVIIVSIVVFLMEAFLPKKLNYQLIGRKGFFTDLIYVVFIDFVLMAIGFYAATSVVEMLFVKSLGKIGITLPLVQVDAWPVWLQFVVFYLMIDFAQWFGHYMMHRIGFLWQFHKIHHAQEQLGFASTRHFHWFEYCVLKPCMYVPLGIFGFSSKAFIIYYLWIGIFLVFLSHANIKIRWGILNYIIITPDNHFWHHSKNVPGKYGVNFASTLTIWDHLIGAFYLPKDKTPKLGVPEDDVPKGFFGQMLWPFKKIARRQSCSTQAEQDSNSKKKR